MSRAVVGLSICLMRVSPRQSSARAAPGVTEGKRAHHRTCLGASSCPCCLSLWLTDEHQRRQQQHHHTTLHPSPPSPPTRHTPFHLFPSVTPLGTGIEHISPPANSPSPGPPLQQLLGRCNTRHRHLSRSPRDHALATPGARTHITIKMPALTSAAGLVGFLSEPDPTLQAFALERLNEEIDSVWTEVSGSIGQM